ncbi:glycosyltransferase [Glaesserella parasuis]|uniref:glycosyltransferase n=1 Tax=Glaesserella parasuis TaxID=738 RepID=UPI002436BA00|nr:glycosyltransferase [Glaesserella parasuis]MDG6410030.1 glycosyltransferase [Glaesserella parasuis]MDO9780927.1 glycosyltransferase [Glaesserella parasuis]MDO9826952.1 glycosyltransferase [Glaesserella parasuis]MDO9855512.1 glycosyltransferase [Glaesserella parasuis]MDO9858107.1 glycosyltransferase [Glaesserella parasuis]
MKILVLNRWFVTGGIERVLISYLDIFKQSKFDTTVVSIYDVSYMPTNLHSSLTSLDDKILFKYILDSKESESYFMLREKRKKSFFSKLLYEIKRPIIKNKVKKYFKKYVVSNEYDLIIDFSSVLDINITEFKNYIKKPIVKWIHSQLNLTKESSQREIEKISNVYNQYDAIISICNAMNEYLYDLLSLENNKLYTLYNPINITDIYKKNNAPISINDEDYFLNVSRLVKGKGLLQLVDIYSELKKLGLKQKLYIIGDGELRCELEQKISFHKLEKDCILLGEITNPYPYFKDAKLFLFTSESEGLGMVIIESLANGTPVVAMDCPTGPKEILGENSEYGKLIPMHNKEAFTEAVIELLDDNEKYQYYCKKSIQRSLDFSSEKISEQVQQLFTEIIKKHKS